MSGTPMPVAYVGSVPFVVTRLDEAVDRTIEHALDPHRHGLAIRLANAWCVTLADQQPDYASLLSTGGLNYPDGAPVAWAMRRSGNPTAGRVRGPSFFAGVLETGQRSGLRHYFFGADAATLKAMEASLRMRYPQATIAGASAPDFQPDPAALAAQLPPHVTPETVDVVWVGLGSPKQDFVTAAIARERGVVAVGVGAAFDFIAGTVPEAPKLLQDSGFEWLHRLIAEPKRLWRRYLIGNMLFLRLVLAGPARPMHPTARKRTAVAPLHLQAALTPPSPVAWGNEQDRSALASQPQLP